MAGRKFVLGSCCGSIWAAKNVHSGAVEPGSCWIVAARNCECRLTACGALFHGHGSRWSLCGVCVACRGNFHLFRLLFVC